MQAVRSVRDGRNRWRKWSKLLALAGHGIGLIPSGTATESVTITNTQLGNVSVADSPVLVDSPALRLTSFVSVSEVIAVADVPSLVLVAAADLSLRVSDALSVTEASTARLDARVSVTDSLALAEALSLSLSLAGVSESDVVNVSDAATGSTSLALSVTEGVIVSEELVAAFPAVEIAASEAVTAEESVFVELSAEVLSINASDSVATADVASTSRLDKPVQNGITNLLQFRERRPMLSDPGLPGEPEYEGRRWPF